MKRYIIAIILTITTFTLSKAQDGLEISSVFKSIKEWKGICTYTHITGKSLKDYNLTLFRSITTNNDSTFQKIEQAVTTDSQTAIDKECGYINGKLYYGFFLFEPIEDKYRYIFYRNSSLREDEPDEMTMVYMEGYPTLEELKRMFR